MRRAFPDFATVLKETEANSGQEEAVRRSQINLASAFFSAGLGDSAAPSRPEIDLAPLFYFEEKSAESDQRETERQAIAERMQNQSPDAIRRELNLRPGLTRAELQRLRRSFAASNHPDRLPQEFRADAEQRMKMANALLDTAMATAAN
ncbi:MULTISPECIES: hypothetical protein [Brucella]|uniref:J domain-containing protein n=1 Tax=Ochrobactrum soli TaxID=2448455 RepID=A0A2P9HJB1_9HYPH|nr:MULTISPECIES: hypothetical protein [Brucella]RRD27835.1 hypothetical protein ECB98_01960 [Brucellaceae bacterium VT-16-1752]WHT41309.1 hypothetical protein QLQ11_07700 [Ochrobactrum sp. SSR]MDX4075365.1 hypothetical protein [Brucella sp. NBRC 113783]WHS32202.1 hypothetical protein QLQ09_09695 [Brucella sp. NM4]SPL64241.1 FIG00884245: hypothetical protein [[Ochrobactrum] soli]